LKRCQEPSRDSIRFSTLRQSRQRGQRRGRRSLPVNEPAQLLTPFELDKCLVVRDGLDAVNRFQNVVQGRVNLARHQKMRTADFSMSECSSPRPTPLLREVIEAAGNALRPFRYRGRTRPVRRAVDESAVRNVVLRGSDGRKRIPRGLMKRYALTRKKPRPPRRGRNRFGDLTRHSPMTPNSRERHQNTDGQHSARRDAWTERILGYLAFYHRA
jgi:hypothetical protein